MLLKYDLINSLINYKELKNKINEFFLNKFKILPKSVDIEGEN